MSSIVSATQMLMTTKGDRLDCHKTDFYAKQKQSNYNRVGHNFWRQSQERIWPNLVIFEPVRSESYFLKAEPREDMTGQGAMKIRAATVIFSGDEADGKYYETNPFDDKVEWSMFRAGVLRVYGKMRSLVLPGSQALSVLYEFLWCKGLPQIHLRVHN